MGKGLYLLNYEILLSFPSLPPTRANIPVASEAYVVLAGRRKSFALALGTDLPRRMASQRHCSPLMFPRALRRG